MKKALSPISCVTRTASIVFMFLAATTIVAPAQTFSTLANFDSSNGSNPTLDNIAMETTGDFAVSATTCTPSLPAKGKCKISVTFTPQATGTRTGQLNVSDSADTSPQTASLTGTGK